MWWAPVISRHSQLTPENRLACGQTGEMWLSSELRMDILTAGQGWWGAEDIASAWRKSHEEMAAATHARKLVVAESSAHNIPATEPALIVDAVARLVEDLK